MKKLLLITTGGTIASENINGEGLSPWPAFGRKQKGFRHLEVGEKGLIYPGACHRMMFRTMFVEKGPM